MAASVEPEGNPIFEVSEISKLGTPRTRLRCLACKAPPGGADDAGRQSQCQRRQLELQATPAKSRPRDHRRPPTRYRPEFASDDRRRLDYGSRQLASGRDQDLDQRISSCRPLSSARNATRSKRPLGRVTRERLISTRAIRSTSSTGVPKGLSVVQA